MEEVVTFLKERGFSCFLQEVQENSRLEAWTPGSIILNRSLSRAFSHLNLHKSDPPRWVSMAGEPLLYPGELGVPEGYCVFMDWFFVVEPHYSDCRGWKYHVDIQQGVLLPTRGGCAPTSNHKFRRRRWQRILVDVSSEMRAHLLVETELHANSYSIRTLSPLMIKAALGTQCHEIQYIMESERRSDVTKPYCPAELGVTDPPYWASGRQANLTDDPLLCPVEDLLYPNKDEEGWEYSIDFSADSWSATSTSESRVRRRLWFRPCVRDEDLNVCRDILRRYIAAHPRGVVKEGRLQRQSHYRKRWCHGTAILTDTKLEISLENNYKGVVVYDLIGCEVISDFDADDESGHSFRFGLRTINEVLDKTQEMRCILNARSRAEQLEWVTILSRQVSQANLSFWNLTFGPPVNHSVLIQGNMWKQGSLTWQFRKFELHGDGVLLYWKENILKGKIKLTNCLVDLVDNGYPFSFSIKKKNGYCMILRTSDETTRAQWIDAIRSHTTTSHSPQKAVLPREGTRQRQESLTDIPKLVSLSVSDEQDVDVAVVEEGNSCVISVPEGCVPLPTVEIVASPDPGSALDVLGSNNDASIGTPPLLTVTPTVLPAVRRATIGPGATLDSGPTTHTVGVSRVTGRRVSVLNDEFKAHLDHQASGIWEASDDSDESDGSEQSRSSSFIDIHASRNRSAVASLFSAANINHEYDNNEDDEGGAWEPGDWKGGAWEDPPIEKNGLTHQLTKNSEGRRVSVLNDTVLNSANSSTGQWGGFDSDEESDGDSRPSSMASSGISSIHFRPPSTHQKQQSIPEEAPQSLSSTVSEFIAKRRNSLF